MPTKTNLRDEESVIAIDIGGSSTKLALVNRQGEIRDWQSFPTAGPDALVFIAKLIAAAQHLQAKAVSPIAGIGVAVAGFVGKDGSLEYNPNLPWLEGTQIGSLPSDALRLPVKVDADSNAACVAEFVFGQGQGAGRFLCLTGGTGLGVGIIVDGKLLRIAHGCLGDAGHVIVAPQGPECSCGGRGCAEALLSTALLGERYAGISGKQDAGFRELVEDAQLENPDAVAILAEAGEWLGIAAASLANIFFPDRIAIAGGLSQAGNVFIDTAIASFRLHVGSFPGKGVSFVRASSGGHATLLGAAASFFRPEIL